MIKANILGLITLGWYRGEKLKIKLYGIITEQVKQ